MQNETKAMKNFPWLDLWFSCKSVRKYFVLTPIYNSLFEVTTLNDKYFRQHLEDSLSLGRSLLIEDIEEELDPVLDNILEKNFIKSGSAFKVSNQTKEVE